MKKLVLASGNAGKLREFGQLLAPFDFEVLPQSAFAVPEAEEPHITFVENAIAKARHGAASDSPVAACRRRTIGVTLIELLIVMAVIGALAAIAIPSYQAYVERANVVKAVVDIRTIALALKRYHDDERAYPASLSALGISIPADPWGRPYQYLAIDIDPAPNTGEVRRDKNLNPINSDFDLYSMGPDGQTQKQLTASKARDDIVRADNGGFVDVASEH